VLKEFLERLGAAGRLVATICGLLSGIGTTNVVRVVFGSAEDDSILAVLCSRNRKG
jgi:hypothetical protein